MSLDALGGRKFLLTLLILAVGTAVQILSPRGVTTEFTALLIGLVGVFSGANAFVTHSSLVNGDGASSEPAGPASAAPVDLSSVLSQLEANRAAIKNAQEGFEAHSQVLANLQQGLQLTQQAARAALTASSKSP